MQEIQKGYNLNVLQESAGWYEQIIKKADFSQIYSVL